jgi:hypothetical protein
MSSGKFFELYCDVSRRDHGDSISPEAPLVTLYQHVLEY